MHTGSGLCSVNGAWNMLPALALVRTRTELGSCAPLQFLTASAALLREEASPFHKFQRDDVVLPLVDCLKNRLCELKAGVSCRPCHGEHIDVASKAVDDYFYSQRAEMVDVLTHEIGGGDEECELCERCGGLMVNRGAVDLMCGHCARHFV